MIWLISGLHDPKWLANILANYKRQTFPCRLLIVENGLGIGKAVELPKKVVVIQSDPGVSQYINAGLSWLRACAHPNDWFCKFDSDDYYGPDYVKQVAHQDDCDYSGRSALFIKSSDNKLLYANMSNTTVFNGPSISARIGTALDFPECRGWGEDYGWCKDMARANRRASQISAEGLLYCRHPNNKHSWPCTDEEMRIMWQVEFWDLGDVDLDVVNGLKPRLFGNKLVAPEIDVENFMPLRILREGINGLRTTNRSNTIGNNT